MSWREEDQDWNMPWMLWRLKICVVFLPAILPGAFLITWELHWQGFLLTGLNHWLSSTSYRLVRGVRPLETFDWCLSRALFCCNRIIIIFHHLGTPWYVLDLMSYVPCSTDAHSILTCKHSHVSTDALLLPQQIHRLKIFIRTHKSKYWSSQSNRAWWRLPWGGFLL